MMEFLLQKEDSIEDRIKNFYRNGGKYTETETDFGEALDVRYDN